MGMYPEERQELLKTLKSMAENVDDIAGIALTYIDNNNRTYSALIGELSTELVGSTSMLSHKLNSEALKQLESLGYSYGTSEPKYVARPRAVPDNQGAEPDSST